MYDGYYAVCTNLVDDSVKDILSVSERRWEIEESFRILKTDFKSRPVYLSREDRIKAHFLVCYLSLLIYRLLEKKLNYKYTCSQIITTLRSMKLLAVEVHCPLCHQADKREISIIYAISLQNQNTRICQYSSALSRVFSLLCCQRQDFNA